MKIGLHSIYSTATSQWNFVSFLGPVKYLFFFTAHLNIHHVNMSCHSTVVEKYCP